ncbi:MAG TPA: acyltransferase [Streptosporangiaceae bacterium]|jgi:acetyltransferase-like isoleucine patch superfamily enzyme|nr:acyltransferase [Streptosporangiaceae bacterium]
MIKRALAVAVRTLRLHRDPVRYFRGLGAEIGPDVEIYGATLFTFGSEPYLVSIGRGVTISHDVDFITHDGGLRVARAEHPGAFLYGRIQIGDGCFLGAHSVFLPGASVGAGSVIGAGAVVSGKIPPGVVATGTPARPVKPVTDYVRSKQHLWLDTSGLSAAEKRALLSRRVPR